MSTTPSTPAARAARTTRVRRLTTETKASLKTTELIFYVLTVAGVLIASLVVDDHDDGVGFDTQEAWFLVTLLTIGYMISRGLAKAGTKYAGGEDPLDNR